MTAPAPPTPPKGTDFLGREAELAVLTDGLGQAGNGLGSLFLIGGEPGIGKSRLVAEFASVARDREVPVLWGRVWEGGGAPAYWPWIQALRAHLRLTSPEHIRRQLGAGAADVAHLLPEITTLLDAPPVATVESDAARFQLFDSVTNLLRNAAADQPLVLVIDDLHAADTPSILLLRFLASQLTDIGLVGVATYRDVELGRDHPLTAALAEMDREPVVRRISLSGLAAEDVARLVAATGQPADPRLVAGLWRRTNGNPFFLSEALRLLATEGRPEVEALPSDRRLALPASVSEAIIRRVQQLPSTTDRVLTVAAVLGPEFDRQVLVRASDLGPRAVVVALDEATAAGLVLQIGPARHRFAHELIREALYERMGILERSRLHARIAVTLEQLRATAPEELLPELAHHYFEAAYGTDAGEAADADGTLAARAMIYAREAAEQATRSLAYEEAARLYAMALQLLEGESNVDQMARVELLLALGDAHVRAGDVPSAQRVLLEAARLARRSGAARQLAEAALGYGGRFVWARAGNDPHLVPMLQDALVMLGGEDDRLRVRLLSRLACAWRSSADHFDQSDALSQQALDLAHALGDPATISYALVGRVGAIWWPHTTAARGELVKELIDVAELAGDMERAIDGHMSMSFVNAETGRMTDAWAEIEMMDRLAEDLRQPAQQWLGRAAVTCYSLLGGDYARAERLMAIESRPGYPSSPARDDVSGNRMHRFLLARERGQLADEAALRATASEFPWYAAHRAALVHSLLDQGKLDRARAAFEDLARDDFGTFARDNEWLLVMAMASEACHRLADSPRAGALYDKLRPFAGMHALGVPEGSLGSVDRYLGLLAATLSRLDDAARHLDDAVRLNEQMGARPWAAHSQADLAKLLRKRAGPGDAARAAELERSALAAAEQLGMVVLAERLRAPGEVGASAEAAPTIDRPANAATFRREGEYWTIAFAGDEFRLRDAKGLRYLARLLAEPGRELLALDLAGADGGGASSSAGQADLRAAATDAGAALDAEAKRAYRARLNELQAELDEAEAWHDAERADRARSEIDFIARELAHAVGLGGRDRTTGSPSERARLSVTRAIRLSIARIAEHSLALDQHLAATIHTGTYCAYRPDPRAAIEWQL